MESKTYISTLLDELDAERAKLSPDMQNDDSAYSHVESFASKVFALADRNDRNGTRTA